MKTQPLPPRAHRLCSVAHCDPVHLLFEPDVVPCRGLAVGTNSRQDFPRGHGPQGTSRAGVGDCSVSAPHDAFVFTCASVSLFLKWDTDTARGGCEDGADCALSAACP